MPIVKYEGKILTQNGRIASSIDCCCEDVYTPPCCIEINDPAKDFIDAEVDGSFNAEGELVFSEENANAILTVRINFEEPDTRFLCDLDKATMWITLEYKDEAPDPLEGETDNIYIRWNPAFRITAAEEADFSNELGLLAYEFPRPYLGDPKTLQLQVEPNICAAEIYSASLGILHVEEGLSINIQGTVEPATEGAYCCDLGDECDDCCVNVHPDGWYFDTKLNKMVYYTGDPKFLDNGEANSGWQFFLFAPTLSPDSMKLCLDDSLPLQFHAVPPTPGAEVPDIAISWNGTEDIEAVPSDPPVCYGEKTLPGTYTAEFTIQPKCSCSDDSVASVVTFIAKDGTTETPIGSITFGNYLDCTFSTCCCKVLVPCCNPCCEFPNDASAADFHVMEDGLTRYGIRGGESRIEDAEFSHNGYTLQQVGTSLQQVVTRNVAIPGCPNRIVEVPGCEFLIIVEFTEAPEGAPDGILGEKYPMGISPACSPSGDYASGIDPGDIDAWWTETLSFAFGEFGGYSTQTNCAGGVSDVQNSSGGTGSFSAIGGSSHPDGTECGIEVPGRGGLYLATDPEGTLVLGDR